MAGILAALLPFLTNPAVLGAGLGLGAGTFLGSWLDGPEQQVTAQEGSQVTVNPVPETSSSGLGDTFSDLIKMVGPLLIFSMLGGGGLFGGMGRGTYANPSVVVIKDE